MSVVRMIKKFIGERKVVCASSDRAPSFVGGHARTWNSLR